MADPVTHHLVHLCDPRGFAYGCLDVRADRGADGRYTILDPGLSESQRQQVIQQLEQAREQREREARADERAQTLLTRLLTDDQRTCLEEKGHIEVIGASGAQYRINCGMSYSGNVLLIEKGKSRGSFCIYPHYNRPPNCTDHMPRHDAFLGQLLLLTTDEQKFRRVAYFTQR